MTDQQVLARMENGHTLLGSQETVSAYVKQHGTRIKQILFQGDSGKALAHFYASQRLSPHWLKPRHHILPPTG
jgi:hypothetical protein